MKAAAASEKKIIMLVDDNEIDNFLHKRIIESTDIAETIIVKNSGKSALEYFKEHLHEVNKLPHLLFLDIDMPLVDGFAFLDKFDKYPDFVKEKCHIVVLSSSGSNHDREKFTMNKNVKEFLVKPLTLEALV